MIQEFRDVASFLRGKATPFQLYSATILAGIVAFQPGFREAPGMMLTGLLLLFILNTNLFVAGLTGVAGKLLGLVLQPLSFEVGRFFIDGPTAPFLVKLINGPVTAWFGFENYVATGGLVLGLIFGLLAGAFFSGSLNRFRKTMTQLGASANWQKAAANPMMRLSGWMMFGNEQGAEDWEVLAKRRFGKPVRYAGVITALLVVGFLAAFPYVANKKWLARVVESRAEPVYGATIDLEAVELDLAGSRLAVEQLALCDPNDLSRDLFSAVRLEAGLSGADLLSRKYGISKLEISGARIGADRETPGRRVGPPVKPSPEPGTGAIPGGEDGEQSYSIDGVLEKAEEWKARLAEVKRWLDQLSGAGPESGEDAGVAGETLEERLRRQARELGYDQVMATHRIAEKPRLTIHELVINGVAVRQLPGETLNVLGSDLSTAAHLVEGTSTLKVTSESGRLGLDLTLDRDAGPVAFHYRGLEVETVKGWLKDSSIFPFVGGSFDLEAVGTLAGSQIELPLQVTARGSKLQIGGRSFAAPEVPFTVLISGELDNPKIRPQLRSILGGFKDQILGEGKTRLQEKLDQRLGGKLKGLLQGQGRSPEPQTP